MAISKRASYASALQELKAKNSHWQTKKVQDLEFDNLSWYDMHSRYSRSKIPKDNFDHMWPAVHTMCESLIYEPHLWKIDNSTFHKKGTKLEYWAGGGSVTELWYNGTDSSVRGHKVFSEEQGRAISEALNQAKRSVKAPSQLLVLQTLGLSGTSVVDARSSSLLIAMSIWQRLVFLFTSRCKMK